MLMDKYNLYSDAQAVTSAVASTNVIDHGAARDIGNGEPLYVVVVVDVTMTDTNSNSTLIVTLETDDNEGFNSAATGQTLVTIPAVTAAGTKYVIPIAPGALNERYSRIKYTPGAGGDLSAGSFTAAIVHGHDVGGIYPDAVTIS